MNNFTAAGALWRHVAERGHPDGLGGVGLAGSSCASRMASAMDAMTLAIAESLEEKSEPKKKEPLPRYVVRRDRGNDRGDNAEEGEDDEELVGVMFGCRLCNFDLCAWCVHDRKNPYLELDGNLDSFIGEIVFADWADLEDQESEEEKKRSGGELT